MGLKKKLINCIYEMPIQKIEKANPTEFSNLYVRIKNKELDIHYRKKQYKVHLDKVIKMYLSKNKSHLWIPGIQRFLPTEFTLCILTSDNEEIRMGVRASEKDYFIKPIAIIRNMKSKIQDTTSLGE